MAAANDLVQLLFAIRDYPIESDEWRELLGQLSDEELKRLDHLSRNAEQVQQQKPSMGWLTQTMSTLLR